MNLSPPTKPTELMTLLMAKQHLMLNWPLINISAVPMPG
ncbi:hypothetical protein predicted by Glimmer/Critica [Lactiplantibacillus plantarum]|nr:hypothetical protein predicted by Glimmer/Critica [Lactiplantibacillus plantarum]